MIFFYSSLIAYRWMRARVSVAKRHFVKFNINYLMAKITWESLQGCIKEKSLEEICNLSGVALPLWRAHNCRNVKIINHYFFRKRPKFFMGASPHLNDVVWKIDWLQRASFQPVPASSVARGGKRCYSHPLIGLNSIQNSMLLAVLRLVFALKREIAPPPKRK